MSNLCLFDGCRGDVGEHGSETARSSSHASLCVSDDDGNDDEDDGEDNEEEEQWLSSSRFLLQTLLSPLPSASPLRMNSFKRFTSDSFTGFTRNSSAPSSKHL